MQTRQTRQTFGRRAVGVDFAYVGQWMRSCAEKAEAIGSELIDESEPDVTDDRDACQ